MGRSRLTEPSTRHPSSPTAALASEPAGRVPPAAGAALVDAFLTNERINQVLLGMLDPRVWRAQPPCTQRRTIASTFAHIHNVRRMMARAAKARSVPAKLERVSVTPAEASAALAASANAIAEVLA